MDNPQDDRPKAFFLDASLTVLFDDTDAKIGCWRGELYKLLATVHNMHNPSDAPQLFAALRKRLSEILDLMSWEECPQCEGQGKTTKVTGYVTGDMAMDAGEPEMAGTLLETEETCSMCHGDCVVPVTENVLEAGTDDVAPYATHTNLWQQVFDLRATLVAEREARAGDQNEALLTISAAIKSLADERRRTDELAERLWNAADDSHVDREHPGDFKTCRVQLCKTDREAVEAHNAQRKEKL